MWGRFFHVMTRYMGTTLYVHFDNFYGIFVVKHAIFILKMCHYSCNLYVCFYETQEYSHVLHCRPSPRQPWAACSVERRPRRRSSRGQRMRTTTTLTPAESTFSITCTPITSSIPNSPENYLLDDIYHHQ